MQVTVSEPQVTSGSARKTARDYHKVRFEAHTHAVSASGEGRVEADSVGRRRATGAGS